MPDEVVDARPIEASEEEEALGFTRAFFQYYSHSTCGTTMRLSRDLARRFALDPTAMPVLWCTYHRGYIPTSECVWVDFDLTRDPRRSGVPTTYVVGE